MAVIDSISQMPALYLGLALVIGLMFGSFLNVVIHRLPLMLEREWRTQCQDLLGVNVTDSDAASQKFNLLVPRSRCPSCEHRITAIENIPVLSYLFLRGKCRACQTRIPMRYPLVEILTGLVSVAVVWRFGVTIEALAALCLSWTLIALSGIDIDHKLLPDVITLPLLWAGLFLSLFYSAASGDTSSTLFVSPYQSIIGAIIGYMTLWIVYQLFKLVTGKEGMGYGDFKLLAALGAWLGYLSLPLIIVLSAMVGAISGIIMILALGRDRQLPIPFGPYLAAAGWIAMMWGDRIGGYYLEVSGLANGAGGF